MIGYLSGTILDTPTASQNGCVLLGVGGVGYEVLVPARLARKLAAGSGAELFIHTHAREDALELFGFADAWEKRVFLALTGVSGVGPRTALAILGNFEPDVLLGAVVRGDKALLTSVPGIGRKTAERLALDLSEKAQKLLSEKAAAAGEARGKAARAGGLCRGARGESGASGGGADVDGGGVPSQGAVSAVGVMAEAVAALVALGYRDADAWALVREVGAGEEELDGFSTESLVRSALKRIGRGRG